MVVIRYRGRPIDHAGLLRYIVSFRDHNEFHEQCVERIYCDIQRQCAPEALAVARYTRRGGLDINPFRSSGSFRRRTTRAKFASSTGANHAKRHPADAAAATSS